MPGKAGRAASAGGAGFEGDAVADLEGGYGGADGGYGAGGLVAETVVREGDVSLWAG